MNIAGREIGPKEPPYVIAEVSCNHGGSLDRALELIDAAKSCGADAVKFQCVEADTITIDSDRSEFTVADGPWKGENLHQLYTRTQTPFEWFPQLKRQAERMGITWFASVFDRSAVDLMVELEAPAIKIASFEIVDTPLITYAAKTGKPLILSTGMASHHEINDAVAAIGPYRQNAHALLHCVSDYPTKPEDANLLRIKYGIRHGFIDGLSDHSIGSAVLIAAVACGACIIEKHFRLFWHPDTEDSPFSMDETDFANMITEVRQTWRAMQPVPLDEAVHRSLRRSLFAVADIMAGEKFTSDNVRSIRPGHGLPPGALDQILGRYAARRIERGEPMNWEMMA